MKVLFLTKYDQLGASSRYRTYQFFDFYQKAGIRCFKSPLFSDDYLEKKYKNNSTPFSLVLFSFVKRFLILFTVFRYDLLVIEKEIFPYFPAWPEKLLKMVGKKYIVDYDDALFHQYDQHHLSLVRRVLGRKIAKVMYYADSVIVGNEYLADYARISGAQNITVVSTVIDLKRYPKNCNEAAHPKPVVGWIGSPSTVKYVYDLLPVFRELNQITPFTLHIVGAVIDFEEGVEVKCIPWSEATEVTSIQQFDVGIMPLLDSAWERGKCGFKLIQYMACSKPVVASPVGVNKEIVEMGENGFLAENTAEWTEVLKILLENKALRQKMGQAGRTKVEKRYCIEAALGKLLPVIKKALKENK